jgi:hypothetical protein
MILTAATTRWLTVLGAPPTGKRPAPKAAPDSLPFLRATG